jgi:hypothetical protein
MEPVRHNLDGKFHGVVVKNKDGSIVPPDQWIVFLAKDNAVPDTLRFYRQRCADLGADQTQLVSVDALIARVDQWREYNPDKCKVPDVQAGEILL